MLSNTTADLESVPTSLGFIPLYPIDTCLQKLNDTVKMRGMTMSALRVACGVRGGRHRCSPQDMVDHAGINEFRRSGWRHRSRRNSRIIAHGAPIVSWTVHPIGKRTRRRPMHDQ